MGWQAQLFGGFRSLFAGDFKGEGGGGGEGERVQWVALRRGSEGEGRASLKRKAVADAVSCLSPYSAIQSLL